MSLIINPYSVQAAVSGPTPLVWLKFENNLTDDGSSPQTWGWYQAQGGGATTGNYTADGGGYGDTGRAATFDGSAGMPIPQSTFGTLVLSTFSVCIDYKLTATSADGRYLFNLLGGLYAKMNYPGNVSLQCGALTGGGWLDISSPTNDQNWHRLIIAYNGSSITPYVDGTAKTALTGLSGSVTLSGEVVRVANQYWNDGNFIGSLDNFQIYNTAITP